MTVSTIGAMIMVALILILTVGTFTMRLLPIFRDINRGKKFNKPLLIISFSQIVVTLESKAAKSLTLEFTRSHRIRTIL